MSFIVAESTLTVYTCIIIYIYTVKTCFIKIIVTVEIRARQLVILWCRFGYVCLVIIITKGYPAYRDQLHVGYIHRLISLYNETRSVYHVQ